MHSRYVTRCVSCANAGWAFPCVFLRWVTTSIECLVGYVSRNCLSKKSGQLPALFFKPITHAHELHTHTSLRIIQLRTSNTKKQLIVLAALAVLDVKLLGDRQLQSEFFEVNHLKTQKVAKWALRSEASCSSCTNGLLVFSIELRQQKFQRKLMPPRNMLKFSKSSEDATPAPSKRIDRATRTSWLTQQDFQRLHTNGSRAQINFQRQNTLPALSSVHIHLSCCETVKGVYEFHCGTDVHFVRFISFPRTAKRSSGFTYPTWRESLSYMAKIAATQPKFGKVKEPWEKWNNLPF